MPAVRHVRRAGGALGQPFPVDVRAVSGRYLHPRRAGMALEPGHEALLGALREKVHDLAEFEIDEDGAVGAALLEREVVHAQNPDLADLRQRRALDPPQQGVNSWRGLFWVDRHKRLRRGKPSTSVEGGTLSHLHTER